MKLKSSMSINYFLNLDSSPLDLKKGNLTIIEMNFISAMKRQNLWFSDFLSPSNTNQSEFVNHDIGRFS